MSEETSMARDPDPGGKRIRKCLQRLQTLLQRLAGRYDERQRNPPGRNPIDPVPAPDTPSFPTDEAFLASSLTSSSPPQSPYLPPEQASAKYHRLAYKEMHILDITSYGLYYSSDFPY